MSVSDLLPASFRGVTFGVQQHELTTGRRTVKHVFPGKDDPYVEDLGRKDRSFSVEGFVVGTDYRTKRDALLQALEAQGPGKLVHPYFGEMTVQVGNVNVKETWNEGGVARFTFDCTQTSKVTYPKSSQNTVDTVAAKKDDAWVASSVAAQRMRLERASSQAALQKSTTSAFDIIKNSLKLARNAAAQVQSMADGFTKDINNLALDIQGAITEPIEIVYGFQSIIERVGTVLSPAKALDSYRRMYNDLKTYYSNLYYAANAGGVEQALNDAIMGQAVKTAVVGAACVVAAASDWDSRKQAEAARDELRQMLTDIMDACTDDTLFEALAALRQGLGESVPSSGARLKDLKSITLADDLPAIVLSMKLYGTIDLADDITARNNVRHPSRCPAAKPLEVIA